MQRYLKNHLKTHQLTKEEIAALLPAATSTLTIPQELHSAISQILRPRVCTESANGGCDLTQTMYDTILKKVFSVETKCL